jgi:hypothetical protein
MATSAAALPRIGAPAHARARVRVRHFPVENVLMYAISLAFYIAVANYFVFHLHYMINDAYARIDNAFDVLFTRDPHLGAIGFVWPPLPSFFELPIIAFKGFWPALVTQGFAGSIEAAMFSAGTVVLLNSGLKWAGVVRGMRWIFCAAFAINPMIVVYAAQGMSEAPFIFFFVGSILVYLRWAESRRAALLPLMGILAGAGCLCRVEMFLVTLFIGVGVVLRSVRWRVSWREIETVALLYALPAILIIGLWIGSMAVIEHDPLYFMHAQSGGGAQGATPATQGLVKITSWRDAFTFVTTHSALLFPAAIAAILMLGVRLVVKGNRLPSLILLGFVLPVGLIDVYLLKKGGLSPTLRYQIYVIPYAFLVCVYVLRSLRARMAVFSSLTALGMIAALALSNIATTETISNPDLSMDEAPGMAALMAGKAVEQINGGGQNAIALGAQLAPRVMALDKDKGLIACDSTTCFPIVLNFPDPKLLVVTSDRDFQAVLAQPKVYHVEYFLVQNSGRDQLNITYPGLWEDGAGFSSFVGDLGSGWRLYRITGDTGRG